MGCSGLMLTGVGDPVAYWRYATLVPGSSARLSNDALDGSRHREPLGGMGPRCRSKPLPLTECQLFQPQAHDMHMLSRARGRVARDSAP